MVGAPRPVVVYKSLNQVWKALTFNKDLPELKGVINLCFESGLLDGNPNKLGPDSVVVPATDKQDGAAYPFIVIEGMDGTGKTTLTRFLSKRLSMKLMSTPPKNYEAIIKTRDFFDGQSESVRRAFYSLGNYLAAHDVIMSKQPVVMDRFWHSTSAYAIAHQMKSGEKCEKSDLIWPEDLLKPDLVIFLQVSEQERLRRHSTRKDFTNTKEEQTLANDNNFRNNLGVLYKSVVGPPMTELLVDGEQSDSEAKLLKTILNSFPNLKESIKIKH